jgi:hypothetical protein
MGFRQRATPAEGVLCLLGGCVKALSAVVIVVAVGAVVTVTVTARVFVPVGPWELGWSGDTAVALGEVFGGCRTGTSNGARGKLQAISIFPRPKKEI